MKHIKYLFFIFISLLIIGAVQAKVTETVKEKWFDSGDTLTLLDRDITVYFNDNESVSVVVDGAAIKISSGLSKEIDNLIITYDESKYKDFDLENFKIIYELHLKFDAIIANVSLTRNVPKTDLFVGQYITINSVFQNQGDLTAADVLFEDDFSSDFQIKKVDYPCLEEDNKIYWEGTLKKGQRKECSYIIKAIDKGSQNSLAKVKFFNGVNKKTISSEAKAFTIIDSVLDIKAKLSDSSLLIGENTTINVTLTNTKSNETIEIKQFKIEIPKGFRVLDKSKELKTDYSYLGTLNKGEQKSFYITGIAERTGAHYFNADVSYIYKGFPAENSASKSLKVESGLELNVMVTPDNINVDLGDSAIYKIIYENMNSLDTIYNIKTDIISELSYEYEEKITDELQIKHSASSPNVIFNTLKPGSYNVLFNTTYQTQRNFLMTEQIS